MAGLRHTLAALAALAGVLGAPTCLADPLTAAEQASLARGQPVRVLVEFHAPQVDRSASAEVSRRRLNHEDDAVLAIRAAGYRAIKDNVEAAVQGTDARRIRDYAHFPLQFWEISSTDALSRLTRNPAVRSVYRDSTLHVASVSDLPFISQPQTAAEGAQGAGTTIAVIDGGLGTNYLNFPDFGTCTGVGTPASTCRVVVNQDFYPGASAETQHGTNVSAIALGVAPAAKLAMFDVFNGVDATVSDINTALESILTMQSTYNIVAVNLSLGDGSSHATQCPDDGTIAMVTTLKGMAAAGVLPVVAAGNNNSKTGLASPACVQNVVSVGAVYDASYGSLPPWQTGCTDTITAPDRVTCFSQSASYLTLLAPGTFVRAPDGSNIESGTSQATPHVSGAVAVLRAQYPAESVSETVQRMQLTGVMDTDPANSRVTPRLNLLAATNAGSAMSLTGTGPTTATAGGNGTYTLKVTNSGPLAATDIRVVDVLPVGANVTSMSSGCTRSGRTVTCLAANLGVGSSVTFTILVSWAITGPVYDSATVFADQPNTSMQQAIAFGTAPSMPVDGPLPEWAYALLALGLAGIAVLRLQRRERAEALAG